MLLVQHLKDEQKSVRENLNLSSKQMKLWGDLEKLLACKKKCLEREIEATEEAIIHREPGTETLVL
jgi:intraflagellar transport protein 81